MADNKKMAKAKQVKNDEFYTEYDTIADELGHYRKHFLGQVVYCNCDDPTWSNFWKYFHNNFASLGLRKLISTHYQKNAEPSYAMIYEGGDDFNMDAGRIIEIRGNTAIIDGKEVFYTAGDFRSAACVDLLREANIVVTNPPFSLFSSFIKQIIDMRKHFLVLGNRAAFTYKDVFPYIKNNQLWIGYASTHHMLFGVTDEYAEELRKTRTEGHGQSYSVINGRVMAEVNACWFTNMDISKRHNGLWHVNGKYDDTQAHVYYEGHEHNYPEYDNHRAIEISKTSMVPIDFRGVMGVPITWLEKYNPDEFEILGTVGVDDDILLKGSSKKLTIDGKNVFKRIFIRNLHPIKKSDDLGY